MRFLTATTTILLSFLFVSCSGLSPKGAFYSETNLRAPEDSTVVMDKKSFDFTGDGERMVLMKSSPEGIQKLKKEALDSGYTFRSARNRLMALPEEMLNDGTKENFEEFIIDQRAKTTFIVFSENYIFMWIGWI